MRSLAGWVLVTVTLVFCSAANADLITPAGVKFLQRFKASLYSGNTAAHAEQVAAGAAEPLVHVVQGSENLPVVYFHFAVAEHRIADLVEAIGLPPGIALVPIAVVEGSPERYYVTITLYQSGGDRVGLRAEWNTYVAEGSGEQPRALMLEAASSQPWLNPVDLFADAAESFSVRRRGRSLVAKLVNGPTSLSSVVPVTGDAQCDVFATREWNAAGDVTYWRNGVTDLRNVNALFANRCMVSVPSSLVRVRDGSAWAAFTGDLPEWVLLYEQPTELSVRPWVNADDDAVPLDPGFRAELLQTKANVYSALEFDRSVDIAEGLAEPLADFLLEGDPPAIFLNFEVLPDHLDAFEASIPLPDGFSLAPIEPYAGLGSRYFLSLNVYLAAGLAPGLRAEWSTYVRKGEDPAVFFMIVEAQTSGYSIDPIDLITIPADVFDYRVDNGVLGIDIRSPEISFVANVPLPDNMDKTALQLKWAEANSRVYWRNGVADKVYYDGSAYQEVSIVPTTGVDVLDGTRFADHVELDHIFIYEQPQTFVVSPWTNLDALEAELANEP